MSISYKMELLKQVSSTQFLFPAVAVAVVLICAALVFIFGFHSAEQPQFDKLPLVVDDRKSSNKKRKPKEKKSSPNRNATEDGKTKSDSAKKSPAKEKKEDKPKEPEKPKPKPVEKVIEPKVVKKEPLSDSKKGKKNKQAQPVEKPVDYDEGNWEEVPKKNEKKKVKGPEEKKESPAKKKKKASKETDVEAARVAEEIEDTIQVTREGPALDEAAERALQAQVQELQRVLKEAELRDKGIVTKVPGKGPTAEIPEVETEGLTEVKDLRVNKKKDKKEKEKKLKNAETAAPKGISNLESAEKQDSDAQDNKENKPVFDELGDAWTDTKTAKKSKKKVRKDQ